ncbi:MAG: hypothetical protein ACJ72N_01145 [Labedaea sp.]
MTIWVVLGVLGIALALGVWLYLRGGSLAERRALRGQMRRIRDESDPVSAPLPPADQPKLPGLLSRYADGPGGGIDGGI